MSGAITWPTPILLTDYLASEVKQDITCLGFNSAYGEWLEGHFRELFEGGWEFIPHDDQQCRGDLEITHCLPMPPAPE